MAIQMRRGKYGKFDPSRLLAGEWAVVQEDDPSASDGMTLYMAFAPGVVKRMATYNDMVESCRQAVLDANQMCIDEITAGVNKTDSDIKAAEALRVIAEKSRVTAEQGRVTAENARVAAESQRASEWASIKPAAEQATEDANEATEAANTAAKNATDAANDANGIIAQLPLPDGNVPRATRRGEVVSVDDAFAAVPLGLKVYGRTRQNLWQNPSGTKHGVTVTSNADGSVTIDGTVSANNVMLTTGRIYTLVPGKSYTISVNELPKNASAGFFVQFFDSSSYVTVVSIGYNSPKSKTFMLPTSATHCVCGFQAVATSGIPEGSDVSGTYRVMLNEGDTAEPWCPPGLTSAEPTQVVVAGKNLVQRTTDGDIVVTGNGGGNQSTGIVLDIPAELPIDEYIISSLEYKLTSGAGQLTLQQAGMPYRSFGVSYVMLVGDNSWHKLAGVSIPVVSDINQYKKLSFRLDGVSGELTIRNPQLELGSTATAYEPPNVTTLNLDPVELRGLPDGTADVLDVGSGSVEGKTNLVAMPSDEAQWRHESTTLVRAKFNIKKSSISEAAQSAQFCRADRMAVRWRKFDATRTECYVEENRAYAQVAGATSLSEILAVAAGNTIIYPLATPTTSTVTPVALPTLPSPVCNVWAVSDVPCEVEMEYIRDINVVLAKLEAAVASNALAIATN